ncbi:MAG: Holliday junction branch migration protein RuvA [Pseudomonadota bacterium]
MIGSLSGRLTFKQPPSIIIECAGVGYDVETPMSTFFQLPAVGDELFLFTHLLVREDAQILYGFATDAERSLFRLLLRVRGVGAKIGLAILSAMSVSDFNRCIEYEDTTALSKIPGIGKKTAERLVIELRDRVDKAAPGETVTVSVDKGAKAEAVDALVALGYRPAEVTRLVSTLDTDGQSAEQIIRAALKQAVG